MADDSTVKILVSVNAKEPNTPSPGLRDLLSNHSLVLLGYWQVPDQSTTSQVRKQFNDEATEAVAELAAEFEADGALVESEVVFTHDWYDTVDSAAAEHDVDAMLTADPFKTDLERILIPLRGDANLERIVALIGLLLRGSEASATLFNVAEDETEAQTSEFILRGAADRLEEEGIDPDRLDWKQTRDTSPEAAIVAAAEDYDLVVVGESEPSLRERILGRITNQILRNSPAPVLVVRRR